MAVIIPRKRKNGVQYTARIRINRGGKTLVDESQTFAKKSDIGSVGEIILNIQHRA